MSARQTHIPPISAPTSSRASDKTITPRRSSRSCSTPIPVLRALKYPSFGFDLCLPECLNAMIESTGVTEDDLVPRRKAIIHLPARQTRHIETIITKGDPPVRDPYHRRKCSCLATQRVTTALPPGPRPGSYMSTKKASGVAMATDGDHLLGGQPRMLVPQSTNHSVPAVRASVLASLGPSLAVWPHAKFRLLPFPLAQRVNWMTLSTPPARDPTPTLVMVRSTILRTPGLAGPLQPTGKRHKQRAWCRPWLVPSSVALGRMPLNVALKARGKGIVPIRRRGRTSSGGMVSIARMKEEYDRGGRMIIDKAGSQTTNRTRAEFANLSEDGGNGACK